MSPTPRRSPSFSDLARGGPDAERERFEEEGFEENAGGPEGAGVDTADEADEADAEREREAEQADAAAEADSGEPVDESREDPAAIDPQIERAEGEGMVTEHAKVSAQDPGPEPLPEPEPGQEPEPDHGPEDPAEPDPEHE